MILDENCMSLKDAAERMPIINGRQISYAMLYNWARRGTTTGVKLECLKLGQTFVTSIEAIERFGLALAAAKEVQRADPNVTFAKLRTSAQRQAAIDRAKEELAKSGI